GEFAVPPGNHYVDAGYYFPNTVTPVIPNAQLTASFAGSFFGVVKSLNPNFNPLPESVTPSWKMYSDGDTEMLFNVTESGEAQVLPFATDKGLLERCDFWKSVAEFIPQ
ncbi:hypothetical protein M0805_005237, partial [Coniferiporia weirii]